MYYVLYDRYLNPIGSSYTLESWHRIQRAYDFDAMTIEGEQIPLSADPFLVVVNDKKGRLSFSGLASTPDSDEKTLKTRIDLKDYRTLWNTDVLLVNKQKRTYLSEELDDLLTCWKSTCDTGLPEVLWDVSRIENIPLEEGLEGAQSISLYSTLAGLLSLYEVYVSPVLDLYKRTLTFVFFPAGKNSVSFKLKDFNVTGVEKSFGDFNRVFVYTKSLSFVQAWGLTSDNQIVRLTEESLPSNLLYPAKIKNVVSPSDSAADINNTLCEAVLELSQNRYQESIDVDVNQGKSIIDLTLIDFSYRVHVYIEGQAYKVLPVGEIETDSKGKHVLRIGYRPQELIQEI